jgi:hypothetical protein
VGWMLMRVLSVLQVTQIGAAAMFVDFFTQWLFGCAHSISAVSATG